MSRSNSYSMDDDPFSVSSSALTHTSEPHEVRMRDRAPLTAARQSSRQSGEWSTRLSTSSSSAASTRRDSLPPTRLGVLKPEDTLKVDAFRLVKPETNPLSITAMETISVLEKQKQAQKEIRRYSNKDESDVDWEQNLSSWKDRRKSKPTFHLKALEIGDDETEDSSTANGKKSKTFKELMEEKEKRSNGHSMYTYEDEKSPAFETLPTASSKRETQPTTAGTKYGGHLKQSEPFSEAATAKQSDVESYSTSRNNFTEVPAKVSDGEPRPTSRYTSGYGSDFGYGSRDGHSGIVGLPAKAADVESYSTSRHNFTEAPADVKPNPSSRHASGFTSEVGYGTRTGNLTTHSTTERERDRQKPYEPTVDLQIPSTKPATDKTDQVQKKTTTESVRPLHKEPETDRMQASSRQRPETSTAVKTTATFEVTMREKPKGSQPQARPASYTPSTRHLDTFLKLDSGRQPARTEVTARLPGSSSSRDSLTSRQLDRTPNPSAESTNRDRRVKSAWEMNFEKTLSTDKSNRSEFRPPQKPVGGDSSSPSSSRFKQTLSLFQSKEAEAGTVGPVKALPPPLATQRSVGRISSRLPAEDFKTGYSGLETRRGSGAERKYQPSTEMSSSYKTDAARLRGVSRSVHGLDMHRSDFGIPDVKNPVPKTDFLSGDRDERYGLKKFGTKTELSDANNVQMSSSRAHSSDDEREKISRTLSGKIPADVDMPEVQESRRSSQLGHVADKQETEPWSTKRHDANGLSESGRVGVKSSYSRKETHANESHDRVVSKQKETEVPQESISVTRYSSSRVHDKPTSVAGGSYSTSTDVSDSDKKTGSYIRKDDDHRTKKASHEEITVRTSKLEDDYKIGRGTEPLKLNEPKELYAYKHRSPLLEESVIGNADTAKQTIKYDQATRRHDEKFPETKGNHFESHKTDPAVRYRIKESYGRDEYKKTDTAPRIPEVDIARKPSSGPYRETYEEPEESASALKSYQRQKPTQQASISDIFSKRSAAVVRGKSVGAELDPHFVPSDSTKVVEATRTGIRAESPAEKEMTRRLEAAVDETIKEFRHDADKTTRTKAAISDDITEAKIKDHQNDLLGRTDYDVTSVTRTSRDPYSSSRRQNGLERTSYTAVEPVSDRITTRLEEPLSHYRVTLDEAKQEEKNVHRQQPAFEVDFAVSEVEKQHRSGEIQMGKGNSESIVLERNKQGENADFRRFDDSLLIKTPKEEKRLAEDQKTALVFHDKGITQDQKTLFEDQKIPFEDHRNPFGKHKTTADDQKTSFVLHDSFHRSEVKTESLGKLDADGKTSSEKTPLTDGWKNSKSQRNEIQVDVDTGVQSLDRNSPDKRIPAVSLATQPTTLHCGLQQELILNFPEPRLKESTKREVSETADDFYFGMAGGTSGDNLRAQKTVKSAELLIEVSTKEQGLTSQIHLSPSKEHRLSPQEHQLPPEEHKLQSHEHKLPSHEHKLLSEEHSLPPREPKVLSQEHKLPSYEYKLPSLEHRSSPLPSQEYKLPSDENKLPLKEHRLSPLSSQEHKVESKEQKLPSPEHKLPSQEHRLTTREETSSSMNRSDEFGLMMDLDSHPDVQPTAENSADLIIIPELDTLIDGTRFDMNSNIPMDTKQMSPPRSTTLLLEELQDPWTFDPSQAKRTPEITVSTTPDEPNELLMSSAFGGGEPATESDAQTSPTPKKRPAPPPKTKPKPKTSKVSDDQVPETDEWGFLPSPQRLDVSASKDKCRLLNSGAMGARRRPKSAVFLLETSDPFGLGMTTDQNGPSNKEGEGHRKKPDAADIDLAHVPAVVEPPAATRLKNKGVRPVSYMEELNSSLFKKKIKEGATPTDNDEDESNHPSSTRNKVEEVALMSGLSSSSIRKDAADEEGGKVEGPARQLESGGNEKAKPGVRVQMPGLMDELNVSLKKKRQENLQDSGEEEGTNTEPKPVSAEIATGDLLNFSDDNESKKDDVDNYDAPPPPLPDAPPPLPNWSAFPASSSSDPPLGPPPGPPSGPPPGLPLLDLSFLEDDPGQIHFRTTGISSDQSHLRLDGNLGKAFPSATPDDTDFSFA